MRMMALAVVLAAANAEAQNENVDAHIAAAQAAAGEHAGMVDRLCPMPNAERRRINGPAGSRRAQPPSGAEREPQGVFENLYYVGMTEFSTWAVTTSDGIIVIDPIFDYSVEAHVVDGLRKLGFDPADITYVLVSHGHGDHSPGDPHPFVVGTESIERYLTVANECAQAALATLE